MNLIYLPRVCTLLLAASTAKRSGFLPSPAIGGLLVLTV